MQKRILTGGLGALALVLVILFAGRIGMFFLTTGLVMAMIHEYSIVVFKLADRTEKKYALLCVGWFTVLANFVLPGDGFAIGSFFFLALFLYFLFAARKIEDGNLPAHFRELMAAIFGVFYLVFLPLFLPLIQGQANGVHWMLLFLFVVWVGDSAAYFGGKRFGKTKLYPLISPKKTREGMISGLIAAIVLTIAYKLLFFSSLPWVAALIIPIGVGITAQLGDLCESFFKRAFAIKDSGSILPGHGGFLDRFDSVIFSAPIMWFFSRVFGS